MVCGAVRTVSLTVIFASLKSLVYGETPLYTGNESVDYNRIDVGISTELDATTQHQQKPLEQMTGPVWIDRELVSERIRYPWMAYLQSFYGPTQKSCGGVLISVNYVLTTAQCVHFRAPLSGRLAKAAGSVIVFGGLTSHSNDEVADASRIAAWGDIYPHEDYQAGTSEHDIALIRLVIPTTPSPQVGVIGLPSGSGDAFRLIWVESVGWAPTTTTARLSVLMKTKSEIEIPEVCTATFNATCENCTNYYDPDSQVCYPGLGFQGVCAMAGGDPIVGWFGNHPILVGLHSFSFRLEEELFAEDSPTNNCWDLSNCSPQGQPISNTTILPMPSNDSYVILAAIAQALLPELLEIVSEVGPVIIDSIKPEESPPKSSYFRDILAMITEGVTRNNGGVIRMVRRLLDIFSGGRGTTSRRIRQQSVRCRSETFGVGPKISAYLEWIELAKSKIPV